MRLEVRHKTIYNFDPAVRSVVQSLRLQPSEFEGQTVIDWDVAIEGAVRGSAFRDGAGDRIETATVLGPVGSVEVLVTGVVETIDLNGVLSGHRERVHPMVYLRETKATDADTAIKELASSTVDGIDSDLDRAHALARAVRDAVSYTPGETDHATTAADALSLGKGVCQDHAHILIAAARHLGMPARYVIGYLHADSGAAEASHAWAEIHVSGLGWVGFDASNGVSPDENYIRLGSGFDAIDASPIRGVSLGAGTETLDVDVTVAQADQ